MPNAHPTTDVDEPITFSSVEEAEMVLESYYETRAELGSSAFFGGASSDDADTIAGNMMSPRSHDLAGAARRFLDEQFAAERAEVAERAAAVLTDDDIPF